MNRSKKIRAIAALGTLSGAVWASTFASFTDSAASTATFTTGDIDITATASPFTSVTISNMKPGDVVYAPLTVANEGSLDQSYSMASTEAGDTQLAAALQILGRKNVATCDAAGFGGVLSGLTAEDVIPNSTLAAASIAARTLTAGASEVLCVRVTFPDTGVDGSGVGNDNALMTKTVTSTLTFTATELTA